MILAAGRGERMRPLTDSLPAAAGGGGQAAHRAPYRKAQGCRVTDLVINHAWLGHKLVEALGDGRQSGVDIQWSAEERAGDRRRHHSGVSAAGAEPFLVINGDTWLDLDYRTLVTQPLGTDLAHLWLVPNPPQHPAGDFALQAGKVVDTQALTFSGVGLYDPAAFAGLPPGRASWRRCCGSGWHKAGWAAACWPASGATSARWRGCRRWTISCKDALINFTRS
ncbi:mannose-1-phosphate guanylyltransferase [Aeromonas hydrophila]|uniref:Mannose-1-phosphate guanylyltransferase n=1 Tax=Aeromonas hydrophila TaxID=644 RepID=A0A926FLS0_AERHY|nr:mannose-1-phosphate guanylyltransferase [Aeromonas hydrophila]